jgi:hypothetical protein
MRLGEIMQAIINRVAPPPQPPLDRATTTADDVRWKRRQADALLRDAQVLGIDVDLERGERQ